MKRLTVALAAALALAPAATAQTITYPASGLLPAGAHLEIKWDDQGKDIATNWRGAVQAPGSGVVVHNLTDGAFPHGFGPWYPVVWISTGPYAGHFYYIGHTTSRVHEGQHFTFGAVLSIADQGHDWAGTVGGWIEFGEAPGGYPGPVASSHWFDNLISTPLVVHLPDPPLAWGQRSWRVWGLSNDLTACGWLDRAWYEFNQPVHGAVVAYKRYHRLPLPKHGDRGIVDTRARKAIARSGNTCRRTHRPEKRLAIPILGAF